MIQRLKRVKRGATELLSDWRIHFKSGTPASKILMYHGIDDVNSLRHNIRHIGIRSFDRHLRQIRKHFEVVTIEDFFNGQPSNRPLCCITFDDGYRNNLTHALEILEKHQCPATIFVTTIRKVQGEFLWSDMLDLIAPLLGDTVQFQNQTFHRRPSRWYKPFESSEGQNFHEFFKLLPYDTKMEFFENHGDLIRRVQEQPSLSDYWALLTDDQVRQLAGNPLITIGSHGVFHNNLGHIAVEHAEQELIDSKNYLEALTGEKVNTLAYPDGSYTPDLLHIAKEVGYDFQLAVEYRYPDDEKEPKIRNRVGLYAYESLMDQYRQILS